MPALAVGNRKKVFLICTSLHCLLGALVQRRKYQGCGRKIGLYIWAWI
jgi:hypothetical protein